MTPSASNFWLFSHHKHIILWDGLCELVSTLHDNFDMEFLALLNTVRGFVATSRETIPDNVGIIMN